MPRCKKCGEKFKPVEFLQKFCKGNIDCLAAEGMYKLGQLKKANAKKAKVEYKAAKENLMTRSDWLKLFQAVFNTYIRQRDKDDPCISCGTTKNVKYDAGHYFATTYSYLRFNEDNVHKQCSYNCNMSLSGNFHEYTPRLIEKIGKEKVDRLHLDRHKKLEITIEEIKDQIKVYRLKIKKLKQT